MYICMLHPADTWKIINCWLLGVEAVSDQGCCAVWHIRRKLFLIFFTEHGSTSDVLCAKFQNDWVTAK